MKNIKVLYFNQLEKLYQQLDDKLPKYNYNVCGKCFACCTHNLDEHNVTNLELDYIEYKLKNNKEKLEILKNFKIYLNEKLSNEYIKKRKKVCPFYDFNIMGCSIYKIRPFSCRTYGPFLSPSDKLDFCYFYKNKEAIIIESKEDINKIPLLNKFHNLTVKYQHNFYPGQSFKTKTKTNKTKSILIKNPERIINLYKNKSILSNNQLWSLAYAYFQKKNYKTALNTINKIKDRDDIKILSLKVKILIRLKNYTKALNYLKEIEKINNNLYIIPYMKSYIELKIGNKNLAKEIINNTKLSHNNLIILKSILKETLNKNLPININFYLIKTLYFKKLNKFIKEMI